MRQSTTAEAQMWESLPIGLVSGLLDLLDTPALVSDRAGQILMANQRRAKRYLDAPAQSDSPLNLFKDLLCMDSKVIIDQMERGEHEVNLQMKGATGKLRARLQ